MAGGTLLDRVDDPGCIAGLASGIRRNVFTTYLIERYFWVDIYRTRSNKHKII